MKKIAILGSTGSIGSQALEIIKNNPAQYRAIALSCARRVDALRQQIRDFHPQIVSVAEEADARALQEEFPQLDVYHGEEGLLAIAALAEADLVLNSLMGMRGLAPTLAAIRASKPIAFANKETLVAGGELVMGQAATCGVPLLPVDSEHSAIFQSLQGSAGNPVRSILLTASGGPFRGYTLAQLQEVTRDQALQHPNWSMGAKITIDSATMMNKGLEIIEARWLFDVPLEKIQVVVHPQSVLHSAVEFEDGSVIGQMGNPDMRVPIAYAFSYPRRLPMTGSMKPLDLFAYPGGLTFEPADRNVFQTLTLAVEASRAGDSYPVWLNGANEVLVQAFLEDRIRFCEIQSLLGTLLEGHRPVKITGLETILEEDAKARLACEKLMAAR